MLNIEKIKPVFVELSNIVVDRVSNVRDEKLSYAVDSLLDDLQLVGQLEPCVLKPLADGRFTTLIGNRRLEAIAKGALEGRKFSDSAGAMAGRVMDKVWARIVPIDITKLDEALLRLDGQAQRRNLDKVGTVKSYIQLRDANVTEKDAAILLRDLIDSHFPPTKPRPSAPENPTPTEREEYEKVLTNSMRGQMQPFVAAYNGPRVLLDAFFEKLRGNQNWPLKDSLMKLSAIYALEAKDDKTGRINKSAPGPKFQAAWDKYIGEIQAATAESRKPKAIGMMSKVSLIALRTRVNSRILKVVTLIVERELSEEVVPALDATVTAFEKGEITIADLNSSLDTIVGVEDVPAEPAAA